MPSPTSSTTATRSRSRASRTSSRCRRARAHPPAPPRPDARADDAGHRLRPADRRRLRAQADLLLGRQPGRRLAAPLPRRDPERAGRSRSRSRSTATPASPTATSPPPPACRSRSCAATAAPTCPSTRATIAPITCPFTGEQLTAVPALELDVGDRARAARRPRGQRADVGPDRRAEGGGARGQALARHGRGDRRRARAAPQRRRAAELGRDVRGGGAERRASLLRPRLLRARQRLLPRVGRDQQGPQRLQRLARGAARGGAGRELDDRRDDERRGGARAARRRRPASSASGCRARPRTSRAAPTPRSWC